MRVTECITCYFLGAASPSDDEPPPSEDEEFPTKRDQPHLRFEITSDDGFSAEADCIEGKAEQYFPPKGLIIKHLLKIIKEVSECGNSVAIFVRQI